MSDLVVDRAALGPTQELGSGGTARVYRLPAFRNLEPFDVVYKEYRRKTLKDAGPGLRAGLHAIVDFRQRLDPRQRDLLDKRCIWPLRVVIDEEGRAVGILMRLIPPVYFQELRLPSGVRKSVPREAQHLFQGEEDAMKVGMPVPDAKQRVAICAQFIGCVGLLHHANAVFGDISGRNILYETDRPSAVLVDCDSVRVRGTMSPFGAQPHTPLWEPPEAMSARIRLTTTLKQANAPQSEIAKLRNLSHIQNTATDVYKFALLVVRVLDFGRRRALNRDPSKAGLILRRHRGRDAEDLLLRSLSERPQDRPSMRDWYDVVIRDKSLATLSSSPGSSAPASPSPPPANSVNGSPPTSRAPREPSTISSNSSIPLASKNWVWVEGQGWVRRGA